MIILTLFYYYVKWKNVNILYYLRMASKKLSNNVRKMLSVDIKLQSYQKISPDTPPFIKIYSLYIYIIVKFEPVI